jgi:tetratricopeptide (TPR) repeat protein
MRRTTLLALATLALLPTTLDAKEKTKAAAGGKQISMMDVRVCMGLDAGSKPQDQIPACTKVINSGKVKNPYPGDYYATRAAAYFATNELDKALADLNKALTYRQAPEFYFQRGLLHMAMSKIAEAKTDFTQVMKLKPEYTPSYLMRGIVAYNEAEYAPALADFDTAVQRNPTYYQALFARGATKKRMGDERGGEKDIAQARGMSDRVDVMLAGMGLKP